MGDNNFKNGLKKILTQLNKILLNLTGHKNYNKFIIVSRSRSGSNFLLTKLDSHPNIDSKGAPFANLEGVSSLEKWEGIFSKKPKSIKQVGFKIFYYHPNDDSGKKIWDILESDKSIKIIHLKRENKLKTIVSWEIAEKNNIWANSKETSFTKESKIVRIEKEKLKDILNRMKSFESNFESRFSQHNKTEITYEELIKSEASFKGILNFLNVDSSINLETPIKKQNKETVKDLLENFDDLKSDFQNTEFEHLFNLNE